MTRLFLRLFLGVLCILFVAWVCQIWLGRLLSSSAKNTNLEPIIAGGARLALDAYVGANESESALRYLQEKFMYPVEVIDVDQLTPAAMVEFRKGYDVDVYPVGDVHYYASILPGGERALRFGPLPRFKDLQEPPVLVSLGTLFSLIAGAIALLLRPLNRQLKLLESAAASIAEGNFGARVDEQRITSAPTLARAMNEMARRTESLLNTQREMLQAVSHELRTPLARMRLAIGLLQKEKDEQQWPMRLKSLDSATNELDELVTELLHYVRWESRTSLIDEAQIDLLQLVENVISKLAGVHPSKTIMVGETLKGGHAVLWGDRRALDRAVGNVISNACRFASKRIVVDCNATSTDTTIDINDDGPGIPLADRERVFDPFVRLDDAARGTGLGLTLVRRIVGHYDGSVSVLDSHLGGCRIRIVLPHGPGVVD